MIASHLAGCLERFGKCRSGNTAMLFALSAIPLFGAAGVALDYGHAHLAKSELQAAADAAVVSAAKADTDPSSRVGIAKSVFASNVAGRAFISSAVPSVTSNGDAIALTTSANIPTSFTRVFGYTKIGINATSSAAAGKNYGAGGPACVLALSETDDGAFYVNGTTSFEAINCSVYSNSNAAESLRAVGDPTVTAKSFCTVGGYDINGNFLPLPTEGCSAVPDPFAHLPAPASEACDGTEKATVVKKGEHTLSPGTYCGGLEMMAQANATLEPGIYVVKDGPLIFRSGSATVAHGVFFYVTGTKAGVSVNGGADLDHIAPASGIYKGMAMMQDAAANPYTISEIQGGGAVKLSGALYFPTQTLQIGGNGDLGQNTDAWAIVAHKVQLKGNGAVRIEASFEAKGLPQMAITPVTSGPRLMN